MFTCLVKTVGRITYIVLVQTLNPAQSINQSINQSTCLVAIAVNQFATVVANYMIIRFKINEN